VSFFVGAGLWAVLGFLVGYWATDADRNWQRALTQQGMMPDGPDRPLQAVREPGSFLRRRRAYLKVVHRAPEAADPLTETWRIRRSRRWRLFLLWMFAGVLVAGLVIVILDAARTDASWGLLLIPVLIGLGFFIKIGYRYGNAAVGVETGGT